MYANLIVNNLLEINKNNKVIEAIIIMNIWIDILNNFYNIIKFCRLKDDAKSLYRYNYGIFN